ncbi:DegT/DnrJ/EryC1/StrS family aminotransferase [Marinobacter xestospongiae]|uniref:DegT/DnrJ/EryC1/StrS family aminotransferase n=1 Tax=Marinobacter xestospongiae TaxID=994319 RepID=UPI0020033A8C|nr:aminotransferase class I/II-fold pyridoxal phosphate-dependent enzyme [Marinobacter xestospongiae]
MGVTDGLPPNLLSTSNLYEPQEERIHGYLDQWMNEGGHSCPGVLVSLLEQRLCEYHQSKYCVVLSTGFWALVACLRLKASEGREVIIPSLTYRRLADVVFWAGKVPRFVDVDVETLAISPDAVDRAINEQTAAILAVHPVVNCCNVSALLSLAEDRKVPIVFDAVESVHETWRGKRVGSFGVGEVFSLHASKLINGLEGGYVCLNDPELMRRLCDFRSRKNTTSSIATPGEWLPSEMPDMHAAFALAGLDEIQLNVAHNQYIYQLYQEKLKNVKGLRLLMFDELEQTSFKNIVVEVAAESPRTRDELVELLNQKGILARRYYSPPLHCKSYEFPVLCPEKLVNTDRVSDRFMNLPCGYRVSEVGVARVVSVLEKALSEKKVN